MAKTFTKFTYAPDGSVVYKNTGRRMPATYEVRGSNVYSKGRKIGTISKAQTKAQQQKIARAHANRLKRSGAMSKVPTKPKRAKPKKPRQPRRKPEQLPPDAPRETEFPEPSEAVKQLFAERVKDAAKAIAGNQWMKDFIRKMDADILWEMYENGEYVLEKYFEYYEGEPADTKKGEYARWFIQIYKAYAAVIQ